MKSVEKKNIKADNLKKGEQRNVRAVRGGEAGGIWRTRGAQRLQISKI